LRLYHTPFHRFMEDSCLSLRSSNSRGPVWPHQLFCRKKIFRPVRMDCMPPLNASDISLWAANPHRLH